MYGPILDNFEENLNEHTKDLPMGSCVTGKEFAIINQREMQRTILMGFEKYFDEWYVKAMADIDVFADPVYTEEMRRHDREYYHRYLIEVLRQYHEKWNHAVKNFLVHDEYFGEALTCVCKENSLRCMDTLASCAPSIGFHPDSMRPSKTIMGGRRKRDTGEAMHEFAAQLVNIMSENKPAFAAQQSDEGVTSAGQRNEGISRHWQTRYPSHDSPIEWHVTRGDFEQCAGDMLYAESSAPKSSINESLLLLIPILFFIVSFGNPYNF